MINIYILRGQYPCAAHGCWNFCYLYPVNNPDFWQKLVDNSKGWLNWLFVGLLAIETIYILVKFKRLYYTKETFINLFTGGLSAVLQSVIKGAFFIKLYPAVYEHRIWDLGLSWQAWAIGFLLYTFLQFFTHLIYHKVRLFWCLHEVHHSAISMNVTTGLRTSIFDIVSLEMSNLLLPFIGIHPAVYFVLYIANKFWGTFIHMSEKIVGRIPLVEHVLVSPAAHHIHHARNIRYLDKNYGEVVPWFDKLFGTYSKKTEEPVYGTLKVQHEIGFWEAQVHEFRALWKDVKNTPKLKHKIAYFFMPPGWHPGNRESTAKYIQQRFLEEEKKNAQVGLTTLDSV